MTATKWFPGLLTWIFETSSHPRMQKLRLNRNQVRGVARKLLDSKRQELKAGVPRRDVMSLLGSLFPFIRLRSRQGPLHPVKASASQRQDWRLSDEEIIPQVR